MATTAGHLAIATPRSDHQQSDNSINPDDLTLGSQEASFVSPTKLKQQQQQQQGKTFVSRLTKPTGATPLAEIKNGARPTRPMGKSEFTPLLKTVTKGQFMKRGMFSKTPSKLGKSASMSNLPEMESMVEVSEEGEMTAQSQNEENLVDMSSASVSFAKLPARSPGSSDGAAMLTLREQEKVIDDMRKENFSLKLKIFFMQDRLGKLAPEHFQAVFKENLEFKVEQATLKNDLKKYKRSLLDAERNVARMAEELKFTKEASANVNDPSYVCPLDHGMSPDEAATLKAAQEEAEEQRNEAMFAMKEVEDLKRELWEARREKQRLENLGTDDVVALEAQVEELKGVNEDLDMENKRLSQEVEQKEDELDVLQDQLADEKRKVEELESRGVGPADDDELGQELATSQEEIKNLNKKITDLQSQVEKLRSTTEQAEDNLQIVNGEYEALNRELDLKDAEINSLERKLDGRGDDGTEMQNLREEIRDLQAQIEEYETEKQELERDARQLIEKDGRVARERNEERSNFQTDIDELQIQLRETIEEKERVVAQYQKETERLEQTLHDTEQQKAALKKQIENYMNEEHTQSSETAKMQRALRDETERHQQEVNALETRITSLTSELKSQTLSNEDLVTEINSLNEELRTAKRVEDSLNQEIQDLKQKVFSGGRDSEHLRKLQSENGEFRAQIATLQGRVDAVSAQRDRLTRDVTGLQDQVNETKAIEKEVGSVRAERDDLRKSTMAAQINVAKLKAQVNDQERLSVRERDSYESQFQSVKSQLDDTKRQLDSQTTRLRAAERSLADAREDLERQQAHARNLLSLHQSSPNADRAQKQNVEVRKLEDLLQQSRLRQAELGKINATQLDEINTLNRRVQRLEGELEVLQSRNPATTATATGDRALHSQLTLAKGQLADVRAQLAQQDREFKQRLNHKSSEHELRDEISQLKKKQLDNVQTKLKLEEQIRSLQRQISRLESDLKIYSAGTSNDKDISPLQQLQSELSTLREDSSQKEVKSQRTIRRLNNEIDSLRSHIEILTRDLQRVKKENQRRIATKTEEHKPSALTTQVEKRHSSELRGLGKQIRYLKAKLFREETFRLDLQYAKKFFLMQVSCYETFNKANLHLLQQMGIYPDPALRTKRPRMRSVALFFVAIARMRRLKEDWAEHKKGGKELKESLRRMKMVKKWNVV